MGARGAAITAAQALGDSVDNRDWFRINRRVTPNPQVRDCYEAGYRRYRETLEAMRELWRGAAGGESNP